MLFKAEVTGLNPECILSNTWYAGLKNLKAVDSYGRHRLTRLKPNRLVNPDGIGDIPLSSADISEGGSIVHHKLGNVKDGIRKALLSPIREYFGRRQEILESTECNQCGWFNMCYGGCPSGNKLMSKDPFCNVYRNIRDTIYQTLSSIAIVLDNAHSITSIPIGTFNEYPGLISIIAMIGSTYSNSHSDSHSDYSDHTYYHYYDDEKKYLDCVETANIRGIIQPSLIKGDHIILHRINVTNNNEIQYNEHSDHTDDHYDEHSDHDNHSDGWINDEEGHSDESNHWDSHSDYNTL